MEKLQDLIYKFIYTILKNGYTNHARQPCMGNKLEVRKPLNVTQKIKR